jgi:hypothetical protein
MARVSVLPLRTDARHDTDMKPSVAPATAIRDRMLARALQRALLRGMREHPELIVQPTGAPEVRLVGVDPIRALIIGSGIALGYGVRTQRDALTGALADAIQNGGARGVIVQNQATTQHEIEQTLDGVRLVGATTFNVVVWSPSLFDAFRSPERGRYHRTLMDGLQLIRETARPGAQIIACELPSPTNRGPLEEIARVLVHRYNAALRRAVSVHPDVRVAETPDFTSLADPAAFSADYYRRWADQIVHPDAVASARSA